MKQLDKTIPKGKWEFDKDVTKVFDNMLSRSIPQYNVMRDLVVKWSENYPVGEVLFFRGFCGMIPIFFLILAIDL